MTRHLKRMCLILLTFSLTYFSACGKKAETQWTEYAGDKASNRYMEFDQINETNINQLEVAWETVIATPEDESKLKDRRIGKHPATPIYVNNMLYLPNTLGEIFALNPKNGTVIWKHDTQAWKEEGSFYPGGPTGQRGVTYWEDEKGVDKRIFFTSFNNLLYAINANTGKAISSFGNNGVVDMSLNYRVPQPNPRQGMGNSFPPAVCNNVLITGTAVDDWRHYGQTKLAGDIRGYDVKTGEHLWSFHTIPSAGEEGYDTWKGPLKTEDMTEASDWSWMSCDEALGLVYTKGTAPTYNYYGGGREGDNLFSQTILALDIKTGKKKWHFQTIHHSIWDYDIPNGANLLDVVIDGKKRKIIAQSTKQAFLFVLDRITGEPIWPIEEKPAPQTPITPGEKLSATQPIPTKPLPFDIQGLTDDTFINFSPELKNYAKNLMEKINRETGLSYGDLFIPLSVKGTIMLPGRWGGANWSGNSANPETGIIFVPSRTLPEFQSYIKVPNDPKFDQLRSISPYYLKMGGKRLIENYGLSTGPPLLPNGLPITKPPYGRITAIDLNTGNHLWVAPIGTGPKDHPDLKSLGIKEDLGWSTFIFSFATQNRIFAFQGSYARIKPEQNDAQKKTIRAAKPFMFVLDQQTGKILARRKLSGFPIGSPMTYMHEGKQYILYSPSQRSITAGEERKNAKIIALGLPN